jgi:hypothetical protein
MPRTLRTLLLHRAARLQERPALTAPGWGTLSYAQFRNRVEGVAMGLWAGTPPPVLQAATGTPWDWVAEVAVATSGLAWAATGAPIPGEVLGGPDFHAEGGRGPCHALEQSVREDTPFSADLAQGEVLLRLQRLNLRLGWDHDTRLELPLAQVGEAPLRAALWSLLYAGGHAVLGETRAWDARPFEGFWESTR